MIGFWQPVPPDAARRVIVARTALLHGQRLVVEQCAGEPCWHWSVRTEGGHELEAGVAPDIRSAEQRAEDAAFHIHPPTLGDWVERLM